MINQPLKTWAFTDNTGLHHVHFDGENLQKKLQGVEHSINISLRKMLTYEEVFTNYKTDTAILKYLASSDKFDHSQFNQKDEKHWRFWRYIYLFKIPNLTLKANSKNTSEESFLEISNEGVRVSRFNIKKEKEYLQDLRLDNLFFYGPKMISLSLEDRVLLRQSILDALNPDAKFSLSDAFTLWDYSKIPYKKWEFLDPNSPAGRTVEIRPSGYVIVEDWINPRDGIYTEYSFEEIWAKKPYFISQYDQEINEWIALHFEKAMI